MTFVGNMIPMQNIEAFDNPTLLMVACVFGVVWKRHRAFISPVSSHFFNKVHRTMAFAQILTCVLQVYIFWTSSPMFSHKKQEKRIKNSCTRPKTNNQAGFHILIQYE
jgi:hypothetical protein